MPEPSTPEDWVLRLRALIKVEIGRGWTVKEVRGKVQLTQRLEDGSRSSVVLTLDWKPSRISKVLLAVQDIRETMTEQGVGLQAAAIESGYAKATAEAAVVTTDGKRSVDWAAMVDRFLESKADRRETTKRDLRLRLERFKKTIQGKPCPRDGKSLMRRYAKDHLQRLALGGQGRKRNLKDIAAFLTFACKHGAPERWMPLQGEDLQDLIGYSDRASADELTPPVLPDQLAGFLDHLEAAGKSELWLAVALVGLYGLRPAELGALKVKGDRLWVANVKRNKQTMRKPVADRLVLPLDLPGREGEGDRALKLYSSELVQLPAAIRTQIAKKRDSDHNDGFKAIGDAFRQLLDREPYWASMAAATSGLTPYSLRHGYAWRGAKSYSRSIPIRDLAALMGHNPATHHKHYGKWNTEQELIRSVQSVMLMPCT